MEKSSKKAEKGNIMEKSSKKAEKGIYGIYGKIRALKITFLPMIKSILIWNVQHLVIIVIQQLQLECLISPVVGFTLDIEK
ncbi:hypothetical protein T03_5314 [Trichinella britovi]|uniref:Uncharacterized protein n=1 Tax=Trichinella britovi TaxID=45882 RepID=A0A0V1AL22_TRIBR|nr:hypothetical protein T03_5314 [Trichinella britovi]